MSDIPRVPQARSYTTLEFWISNAVILASTVIGVYLAAQAGLTTALQFEIARSDRDGFFMRRALLDEVKDNLNTADQFVDYVTNKDGWRYKGTPDAYRLQGFIWETMKEQSVTFQLPPEALTGIRRYYDESRGLGDNMAQGQGTAIEAAKAWAEKTKAMRESVVPAMEKDIAALKGRLEGSGVRLD